MPNYKSNIMAVRGAVPPATSRQQGATTTQDFTLTLAAGIDLAADDKLLFGILPENNMLVGISVHLPDLDTSSALVSDVGLFKGEDDDFADQDADAYYDGLTVGRGAGVLDQPNSGEFFGVHSTYQRLVVGMKIITAPANPAGERVIRGIYIYKPTGPQSGAGID